MQAASIWERLAHSELQRPPLPLPIIPQVVVSTCLALAHLARRLCHAVGLAVVDSTCLRLEHSARLALAIAGLGLAV